MMAYDPQLSSVKTLLPESRSSYRLPVNIEDRDFRLFQLDISREIPSTHLLKLHDVRISADGLLFQGSKVLPESFPFDHAFHDWKSRRRHVGKFLFENYLLKRTRRIETAVYWITDIWSIGYFHWLADALPRLYLIRANVGNSVLLLPNQYEKLPFVDASLRVFGIKNVEYLGANEVLYCRELLVPSHVAPSGHYNFEVLQAVREMLVRAFREDEYQRSEERVYLSRVHALRRRIRNEHDVIEVLKHFNFKIVETEKISFADQVRLLSKTRFLISNHGAGLTNMMFMHAGGSILELRHNEDNINNCFFTLSTASDLHYYYQTCDPLVPGENAHTADLIVDTAKLERNVVRMLNETASPEKTGS